ncbi:MAG: hypothetical protein ABJQ90_10840 [Parasphingorhabdus sp.]
MHGQLRLRYVIAFFVASVEAARGREPGDDGPSANIGHLPVNIGTVPTTHVGSLHGGGIMKRSFI